jgi:hypothetical protein
MATILRATGRAEKVKVRNGETNGNKWSMRSQPIRANDFVVTDVDLPDGHDGFPEGADVDLIVEVQPRGSRTNVSLVGEWPKSGAHSPRSAA